jgi:hypothetical protein
MLFGAHYLRKNCGGIYELIGSVATGRDQVA